MPRLSTAKALTKLVSGTKLILFWLLSGVWTRLFTNTYMTIPSLVTAGMLLLWYFGVLVVGFTAVGELPLGGESEPLARAAAYIGGFGQAIGNWSVWVVVGAVLSFLRIARLVDLSHFVRLYLDESPIRNAVRQRVLDPLYRVMESGQYERVTVLGHSFGVMIATDVLADFTRKGTTEVRFVTLGGPLPLLLSVKSWVGREIQKCKRNLSLSSWTDFYSPTDWMCSQSPVENASYPTSARHLPDLGGWMKRASGETHQAYFSNQEVMEYLLS